MTSRIRSKYYGYLLKSLGKNTLISDNVTITEVKNVAIGYNVSIHKYVFLEGRGGLEIGNNVAIAPYTSIWTSNHKFNDNNMPIRDQGYSMGKVVIEDDVWIGAHVVVLPGVRVGQGAVIGAGSVVTKNVTNHSVNAGNPAKVIRMR